MRYPYYKHPELFEPSLETLKLWLNTRKSKTIKGSGLLETDKFSTDRSWFILAFSFEIIAFFLTIWGGVLKFQGTHKITPLIFALFASFFFVILDLFGVLLHHKGNDDRSKARNQLNFEKDLIVIGALKKIAFAKYSSNQIWGFICMVLSAGLKIIALRILLSVLKGLLTPVFIIFYLIILYVHVKHTGYWYYAWKTDKRMKSEFDSFEKDRSKGMPSEFSVKTPSHSIQFTSFFKLTNEILCLDKRVKIQFMYSFEQDGKAIHQYKLYCTGILWDDDIVKITREVDSNFQQDIYESCVKIQHAQLGTAVAGIHTPNEKSENEVSTDTSEIAAPISQTGNQVVNAPSENKVLNLDSDEEVPTVISDDEF